MPNSSTAPAAVSADHPPLTRRELAFIAGFWTLYATLNLANRLFDQNGPPPGSSFGTVVVAFSEPLVWALLTPVVFWMASRFDADRTHRDTSRARQIMMVVLLGLVIAPLMAWLGSELRGFFNGQRSPPMDAGSPFADGRNGFGGPRPRRGGPPVWFGFVNALIIYYGVFAAGLARAYSARYRARREQATRLETQLAEARLDALRRQLDPHFLFNTLNAVSALVERDPRGVRRMISRLSDLLRHSFEGSHEPEVPLRQELALLGRYVDIMQVRFQGRLDVAMHIDDRAQSALVPGLILQPLVENAIKHGVERQTTAGHIEIAATLEGDVLVLRVCDDGPGIDLVRPSGERGGVGLSNTVARLAELYGTAQAFTLSRDEAGRTVAEIRLPYHTRADDHGAVPNGFSDVQPGAVRVG